MIDSKVIEQALAKIRDHGANYVYFFQNLNSPDWLDPLWRAGFFRKPPDPHREGNTISYPPWVESQYLTRIVEKIPNRVAEVVCEMEDTENVRVHKDVLDISLKLAPELSSLIVPNICRLLRRTNSLFVHDQIAQLIRHLSCGGKIQQAVLVSRAALELLPDPEREEKERLKGDPDKVFFSRLEPRSIWRTHEYQEILDQGVTALSKDEPMEALVLVCDVLNGAINLSMREDEEEKRNGNDGSVSWRPAVEEHGQNNDFDYKQLLVPMIRDSIIRFLELHPDDFSKIEQTLAKFKWDIFKRVIIHVCRVCPKSAGKKRIAGLLMDQDYFDNYRFKHEWSLLLSEQFKNLSEEEKSKVLGWIETGFDANGRVAYYKRQHGSEPSSDLVEGWKKRWQRDHLFFIANDLTDEWKRRYDSLVAEVGKPEHPDFPLWSSGVMSGSISPKSTEQLLGMSSEELIEYLKEWRRPSHDPLGDSYEGLAGVLQSAIKSSPSKFVPILGKFKELRPDYVKAAIRGIGDAAGEGNEIGWKPLLELCEWVLKQDQGTELLEGEPEEDRHWRWTRMEITRFISASLKRERGKGEIPFEFRDSVWNILRTLVEDPVPTPEYEEKYGKDSKYGSLSINTTRGEAMHALFDYANWVRKHTSAGERENPAVEILEPLTAHLDVKIEPTFTIRSVYSQHLGWLYHFHENWLRVNLERIFPRSKTFKRYREVAWNTYVAYTRPWVPLFKLLGDEYENAIANISKRKGNNNDYDLQHPDDALAEHLVTLYWWGEISIDDKGSLISRFFKMAPDVTRAHAIDFAGRAVWNAKETVPKQILTRLQHLFDKRLEAAKGKKPGSHFEKELSAFGPWVYSQKFDEKWILQALEETLKFTKEREGLGGYVLRTLADLSARHPVESVRCLKFMMAVNEERVSWYFESEKVKTILRNAFSSKDASANQIATEIQDKLLRQGMFEFRNL